VFERPDGTPTALRVAGLDRPGMLQQYFDMTTARDYRAFSAAMKRLQVATFNISYADRDGHLEYIYNGILPRRKTGDHDFWRGLVPGDSSEFLWTDVHPYEDLPRVTNPPAGFIQNTNDPPWFPSWPTPIKAADYPAYIAPLRSESMRSQNALKLISENDQITLDSLTALKLSTRSLLADRTLPDLLAAATSDPAPEMQAAVKLLSGWDHIYSKDTRAGLLFEEWARLFAGPAFTGVANYAVPFDAARATSTPTGIKDPAAAVDMLRQAIVTTRTKYGALDKVFGDVSRFALGGVDLPGDGQVGGLGPFRVITWGPLDKNGRRYPQHGETWVAMIEFTTPVKAYGLMSYGNSRQRGTHHQSDQLGLLSRHELRELWLPRPQAEAHTAETTDLKDAGAHPSRPPLVAAQGGSTPAFVPVQRELFGTAPALSNAWGDYDNDGDLDLALSLAGGGVRLFRNDTGVLVDVSAETGVLQAATQQFRGLSWGDYDGDGFIDLLAGASAQDALTVVFNNEGGKRFRNVAADIGLTIPNRSARQTSWVDYDNDGDVDVYASNRVGENSMFRNDGGRFTPIFIGAGPSDPRPTVGACWLDINGDGRLDLFLANQAGVADAMWRNDGTSFTDLAAALGMTGPKRTPAEGGVGCAVGDYNNDGLLDLFVAGYGRNLLYRQNAGHTFTEVGEALGMCIENHAVGADWGDYDNDGYLDLFVTAYEGPSGAQTPRDWLFHNDAGKGFVNVLGNDGPLNVADHGVQWVDYDNDGGLDLSVNKGYGTAGGHSLFRNALPEDAKRRSLSVLVLDAGGHHTRFGAEVRLFDAAGRILASRLVQAGGGYGAQGAAPVHFGLASMAPVTVEVTFMTKAGRQTQTVRNVAPAAYRGKSLVIRETR
ncbi:MAG: penicillin acylase family protein, partial [Acidobacteria bacterium]|nr:penicillin acylase family protein [Acidobacteriota bacterium]